MNIDSSRFSIAARLGAAPRLLKSTVLVAAIVLPAASPAPAAAQALKTADGTLLLSGSEGRHVVQLTDGRRIEVPLSKSARVGDFRAAETGWLAAAVSRDSSGPRLELVSGTGARVDNLPAPSLTGAARVAQPTFIADATRLHALVWLEGDAHNQLAVRAARWIGGSWSDSEVVSPPGPGTQIALASTVLADGTWLVAWAAYDGSDDEILWSHWVGGFWSAPRSVALDNQVPDITPTLRAVDGGALLAWSHYDGNDYRVQVARFDGNAWSEPATIGARGSTEPTFSATPTPYLVYQHADPRAWAVAELDAAGQLQGQATIDDPRPDRPFLAQAANGSVTLEWVGPYAKTATAALAPGE